jgi:uncharacterized membrane protein HdeD (DUF308 family)
MKNRAISHFKEKPKTKISWWAMIFGLASILEFPLLLIFSFLSGKPAAMYFGPSIGIVGIIITVIALITGTIAYRKTERSWILWLGFGPAILLGLFWLTMIIAEIVSIIFGLGF